MSVIITKESIGKIYEMTTPEPRRKKLLYRVKSIQFSSHVEVWTELLDGEEWLTLDEKGNWIDYKTIREVNPEDHPEEFL